MELTVYRQSSKTRPDGTVVYKGEDALPYVDDRLIMCADGLGGAAAIRHQKIKPELFDEEKLAYTLFTGVYSDMDNENFLDYVKNSFMELFAVKNCYTDNINNIKKSGYFASRIVTAIILHEFTYNEALKTDKFFSALSGEKDEAKRAEAVKRLSGHLTATIKHDLKKIAENANLIYESAYSGLALLGTTLCVTFCHELENEVEAILITAGDSRPYLWTEEEGLQQLVPDEERPDGGMTNYIKANADDFEIRCKYVKFKKPCILFNASDGCFDSGYFISQMSFEKLLLDTALSSENTEAMSKSLHDFFLDCGRHDDSSTIAMKFFGWKDFGDFKKSAEKRLEYINSTYIKPMPDILENDYIRDLKQGTDIMEKKIAAIKNELADSPAVKEYCLSEVRSDTEKQVYGTDTEEIKRIKHNVSAPVKLLEDVVADNCSVFASKIPNNSGFSQKEVEKLTEDAKYIRSQSEKIVSTINSYREKTGLFTENVMNMFDELDDLFLSQDFSDFMMSDISREKESFMEIIRFLDGIRTGKNTDFSAVSAKKQSYLAGNRRLAKNNPEGFRKICEMLVSGDIDTKGIELINCSDDELDGTAAIIRTSREEIERIRQEELETALDTASKKYWNEKSADIIDNVRNDVHDIPEKLFEEIKKALDAACSENTNIEEKAELQRSLFEKYDSTYNKYMEVAEK